MTEHEQFAENLASYALRALKGEERAAMERHLETCAACRAELQQLQGDMALLALSASGPAPPQRAKMRLMEAIAREPRVPGRAGAGVELASSRRAGWWRFVPALAMVVVAVLGLYAWRENMRLQDENVAAHLKIAALEQQAARMTALMERYRNVADVLTAPDAAHFTLVSAPARPVPTGRAIYLQKRAALVFVASNLNPVPAGKTYELWLLPASGAAPIPAGLFKPDARGSATVLTPPLPAGVEAKGFAVTIENEGGSQTPTMPIVMAGM